MEFTTVDCTRKFAQARKVYLGVANIGGKSSQSTSAVNIPPSVLSQYNSVNARATQTANTPFQTYDQTATPVSGTGYTSADAGNFVAGIDPTQSAGIAGTNTAATEAQPYYGAATSALGSAQSGVNPVNAAATGLAGASAEQVNAQPLTGQDINQYLSPYLGDVLGTTNALANQNNSIAQSGALGTAISSGAFGGDRTGIAAANLNQQNQLAEQATDANILNTGYNTALGTAQQQQGVNLSAGQANRAALGSAGSELASIGSTAYGEGANTASELGALGTGAQTAGLAGAQAQIGAGTLQQQTQQAENTAEYNQFLQQQSFPYQVDQFLANIAEGTGALSGSTTTTTQPGGFFSDKRLKHDIKKIGKLFDGQEIYSYKMHGDPRTHIGLIAQKVEKKHPEAVGLARGFKTVDYSLATRQAEKRGKFAEGGLAGYADGGSAMDEILAQHAAMYGQAAGGQGAYGLAAGNVPRGGSSRVPAPVESNARLMTPQGGLRQQPTGIQNVNNLAQLVNSGQKIYNDANRPSTTTTTTPGGLASQGDSVPIDSPDATDSPIFRSRGGIAGYDNGGEVPTELNIPDDKNQRSLPTAPPLQQQQSSPFGDILKLAGTAAEAYGAYAALAAAKRGGRIGKDDGGDVQSDPTGASDYVMSDQTVASAKPPPGIQYTGGLDPVDQAPIQVQTPDKVDTSGGQGGGVSGGDTPWYKKPENVIPILEGLAAMGTAPTRHLGVALAAGLGQGAQSYLPAQQQAANIQQRQLQNQTTQLGLDTARHALADTNGPVAQPTQIPAGQVTTDQGPVMKDTAYYQKKYAVPPMTPQEATGVEHAQIAAGLLKNPGIEQQAKTKVQQRIDTATFQSHQGAQAEHDQLYNQASAMPDGPAKTALLAQIDAIHPSTGDQYIDNAGREINSRTGLPTLGRAAQSLTPAQATEAAVQTRGQNIGALSIEKDENGTPWIINKLPGAAGGTRVRQATPQDIANFGGGTGTLAPQQGPARPTKTVAPPQSSPYLPVNFNSLTPTTAPKGFATRTGTEAPMGVEDYRKAQLAEFSDAVTQDAKQKSILTAAQKEIAALEQNPRAVGPGSKTYNAYQQFRAAVSGKPPDQLVKQEELDKFLNQVGAQNVRSLLSGQKITNQEMMTFMTRGSPNVTQPLPVIKNLVNYLAADNEYDQKLQATKIHAIAPTTVGGLNADPYSTPGAIENMPGASRAEYVQSKLGFTPAFTPTRAGQSAPATETRTYQGKTYTYHPELGPRNNAKSWIAG